MSFDSKAAVAALQRYEGKSYAVMHAGSVLSTDGVTAAPEDSWEGRARTMGYLSELEYSLSTEPAFLSLLKELDEHSDELDQMTKRQVKVLLRETERISRIPFEEYTKYSVLVSEASSLWIKAKKTDDFALFAPYLEKLVAANRRMASLWNPDEQPYNVLLDRYEEGLTMSMCDRFFNTVREGIVPLIRKVGEHQYSRYPFESREYPIPLQDEFSHALMDMEGIDPRRCTLSTTEHPFTSGVNNHDVRITTHYHDHDFIASLFSVLHEGGHALYELGGDDRYNYTCLYGGASMSIHESQSRFYENLIGRSKAFTAPLLRTARNFFPEQLADVTEEMFYRAINRVQPSLIRTEADELTYSLHVMIRYEIEKQLIDGSLQVKDIPQVWNNLYEAYLGIRPTDNKTGCLQDSHWSGGMFGYFPSYALGSAYGAQMLDRMEKEVPQLWDKVGKGDLSPVTEWLHEKIHQFSALFTPQEILDQVCGGFDPSYYIRYLTEKYSELYILN